MNETGLDGNEFCNCGHDRERHSGGYGDCQIGDCNCRGFDETRAEVKAEERKAVELPPIVITQADIDAAEKRFPFRENYHERYPYAGSLVRDRQLLAALTTIAALQDRVKELEAELTRTKDVLKASENWRNAYQDGKYELYSMGGEICEAAAKYLPMSEGPLGRAAKALVGRPEELRVSYVRLEAERDALKAADAWIDVRERLPVAKTQVLTWCDGEQRTGVYVPNCTCAAKWHLRGQSEIPSHWRPLSSPPTQEAK